ncbi:MAG: hypothetical protein AAFR93_04150 [Pseudomonadota bacterium]
MMRTQLSQARALLHRLQADRQALVAGDFRALAHSAGERERLLAVFEGAPDGAFKEAPELVEDIKSAAAANASLMASAREGVEAARHLLSQSQRLETYTSQGARLDIGGKGGTTETRS